MALVILSRRNLAMSILHKFRPAAAHPFSSEGSSSGEENPNPVVVSTESVVGPLVPIRILRHQMLQDGPFGAAMMRMVASGPRMDYDAWEDGAGIYIRIDMLGLGKEDVKIRLEGETLVINGEPGSDTGENPMERREYKCRFDLPATLYKTDQMKIELKNGVLKVLVPKKVDNVNVREVHF